MQMFRGLGSTDYQDLLRALGYFLDERGYRNVRVMEHEEGLMVQATPVVDGRPSLTYETFLLTDAAIQRMLQAAYQRRADAPAPATPPPSTGLTGLLPPRRLPLTAAS